MSEITILLVEDEAITAQFMKNGLIKLGFNVTIVASAEKALESNKTQIDPFYHNILKLDLYWWKYSLSKSKQDAKILKVLKEIHDSLEQKSLIDELNKISFISNQSINNYS